VILSVGTLAGIAIGIQQNFARGPAHAHLNLVGGAVRGDRVPDFADLNFAGLK
jgi:hypothetical protein